MKISQEKLYSFVNALDRVNAEPCKLKLILASEPKSAEVILHAAAFGLKTFRTHWPHQHIVAIVACVQQLLARSTRKPRRIPAISNQTFRFSRTMWRALVSSSVWEWSWAELACQLVGFEMIRT